MKVLLFFSQIEHYQDFAIQEFISLALFLGIPLSNLFQPEDLSPELKPHSLTTKSFKNYPFVVIEVEEKYCPALIEIYQRSVCLLKVIHLYAYGDTWEQLQNMLKSNQEIKLEESSEESYCFKVTGHQNKIDKSQQLQLINQLTMGQFKGKADLKHPQRIFFIYENYEKIYWKGNTVTLQFKQAFFGKSLVTEFQKKNFFHHFRLENRPFLGPTTTDERLSFMMANQGRVKKNSFVYDPFAGTGSLLIAASYFGALCFGGDIDYRVIKGYGVGQLNKGSDQYEGIKKEGVRPDVFLNFKIYKQRLPEYIMMDTVNNHFQSNFFDAIICDPPYNKRAGIQNHKKSDKDLEELTDGQKNQAHRLNITQKLFSLADNCLRKEGMLVFLYYD